MDSRQIAGYLGWRRYLRHRSLELPFAWGWKDPRNTFTLPLWRELFGRVRVIHVWRNGVDVAASLRSRELAYIASRQVRTRKREIREALRPDPSPTLWWCPPCPTLEGGLGLWESYMERARAHVAELAEDAIEIRFEDCLRETPTAIDRLIEFCDLRPGPDVRQSAMALVDPSRAFAFRSDPELGRFAESASERLSRYEPR